MKDLITKNPKCKMLTVENVPVWTDLYLVTEHNDIRAVIESYVFGVANTLIYEGWMQNCIVPSAFIRIANALEAKVDNATYKEVVERFLQNHLNNDVSKLEDYLPDEETLNKALLSEDNECQCNHQHTDTSTNTGLTLTEEELELVFRFGLSNWLFQSTSARGVTESLLHKVWGRMEIEQRLQIMSSPGSIEQLADIGIDVGEDLELARVLSNLNITKEGE